MKGLRPVVGAALLGMVSIVANGQIISFEPDENGKLPDGSVAVDNMAISNQFLRSGVLFGLDNDMDGVPDADGYPYLEEIGDDGEDGFLTRTPGATDTASGDTSADTAYGDTSAQLGQFFLRTTAVNPTNVADILLVTYINPVHTASGELWDIDENRDGYEQWRIEALAKNGEIITETNSPAGINWTYPDTLDGLPWSFEITVEGSEKISSLRFVPCGSRLEYIGLAFNNFSPAAGLGTTNVIGVAKICHATEIFWHSQLGKTYQLQWTQGLGEQWHNLGSAIEGTGVEISSFDSSRGSASSRMYRVLEMN